AVATRRSRWSALAKEHGQGDLLARGGRRVRPRETQRDRSAPDRATVTSRDGGRAAPRAPGLRLRRPRPGGAGARGLRHRRPSLAAQALHAEARGFDRRPAHGMSSTGGARPAPWVASGLGAGLASGGTSNPAPARA